MAVQINLEELKGCRSYFDWITEKLKDDERNPDRDICLKLFATDFLWDPAIKEDEIRAADAMEMRKEYSEEVGSENGKTERDIDKIWKSILGKASILEVLFRLCFQLDQMLNEDEPGSMMPLFFGIMMRNLGLDTLKKGVGENAEADFQKEFDTKIDRFLHRKYNKNGSEGGLFPLKNLAEKSSEDMQKVSLWYQMNAWLNENLDEDEHFIGC